MPRGKTDSNPAPPEKPLERRSSSESARLLEAIVESSLDAIITIDSRGCVVDWNPAAERIFGYSAAEATGCLMSDLIVPEDLREAHRMGLQRAVESGENKLIGQRIEIHATRKGGGAFDVELAITRLATDRGGDLFTAHVRDISSRKQADQAIKDSEALYHSLVENIPLNVLRKDLDGRITFGNQKFFEFTGMSPAATIGKTDHDLYPEELAEQYRADDLQVIETREALERIESHHTPSGRTMYVEVFKNPVCDAEGAIVGVQIIFWDVTERKEAEDALQNARTELERRVQQRTAMLTRANDALRKGNEELARANAELQDFAYIASHDLQEPLRKIQSFSQRVKDKFSDNIPEQGCDYLERMHNAAARMSGLISDLLDLSRVTTKAKPFSSVDLGAVAREAAGDLEARLEQTGGAIEISDLPEIEGDRTQLRQLLQNLLGNALKFHRKDVPPVVKISSTIEQEEGACRISVEDNGIGFDEKYASRIFAVFQRLHGKAAYEGTGIGLAICRKVVERHRGEIVARSAEGEGSVFHITLPLTQAEPDEPTGS